MYHIVYLTTNLVNLKMYVGVHSTYDLDDGYLGSGKSFKNSYRKYGVNNFTRQILYYCLTEEQSLEYEAMIVDQSFIDRKDTYNIKLGGGNKVKHTNDIRRKISEKAKGRVMSTETRRKISESHKGELNFFFGKRHDIKTRNIISQKNKEAYLKRSPEEQMILNKKNSDANMGRTHTKESRIAISIARKIQFPPTAKKFILTDPNGNVFNVYGELLKFAYDNNLSISLLKRFIDKGIIIGKQHKQSERVKNTIGWTIQRL